MLEKFKVWIKDLAKTLMENSVPRRWRWNAIYCIATCYGNFSVSHLAMNDERYAIKKEKWMN